MQEQQKMAEAKRDQVSGELGLLGGSALGLIVGGPTGCLLQVYLKKDLQRFLFL